MTELERLVARVMQTAFIEEPTIVPGAKKRKTKKPGVLKRVERMSDEQKQLLLLTLSGQLATVTVRGEQYAFRRTGAGYLILSSHDGEPEHTVAPDFSACSCQDNKFRGRVCKHMEALKEVLT